MDAKMDDEDHLNHMLSKHFSLGCVRVTNDQGVLADACTDSEHHTTQNHSHTWSSTGQSFKTPQLTAK
jgi:hypothetical protein